MGKFRSPRKPISAPRGSLAEGIPKLLLLSFFVFIPFIISFNGFDNFRLPKTIFSWLVIPLLFLLVLLFRGLPCLSRKSYFEWLLLASLVFLPVHVLAVSNQLESWSALLNVYCFAALFFSVRSLADFRTQVTVWLLAGAALGINAIATVFQYYGLLTGMTYRSGEIVAGRLTPAGLIGEVNSGGFLFALAILFLVAIAATSKHRWIRILTAVFLLANLAGLIYTRTLTALLGLAVVFPVWIVFQGLWLRKRTRHPRRALAWLGGLLLVALLGGAWAAYQAGLYQRVQLTVEQIQQGDWTLATAGRQPMYWVTWNMIQENPYLGRGLQTFKKDFFDVKVHTDYGQSVELIPEAGAFREAHNEYLQIWEELGILGLLIFIALFVLALADAFRVLRREEDPARTYWIMALVLAVIFIAISCLSFFPLHVAACAAFIMLVFGGLRNLTDPSLQTGLEEGGLWQQTKGSAWRWIQVTAMLLLVGFTTWTGMRHWRANYETGISAQLLTRATVENYPRELRMAIAAEAIRRLEKAEALDPNFYEATNLKGTAYLLAGRYPEAVECYQRAAEAIPSPEVYTNLASAYLAQEKNEEARRYVEVALRYNPQYLQARDALRILDGE